MAYRDRDASCPVCGQRLDAVEAVGRRFRRCPDCHGAWVEESVLAGMFDAMRSPPGPGESLRFDGLEFPGTTTRPCPGCQGPLSQVDLWNVPIDRCDQGHGIWFDREELELALRRSVAPDVDPVEPAMSLRPPTGSLRAWGVLRTILDLITG